MDMPLVTFVILHYMALDVTIHCINSILNKTTYQNYKIVIVDNGSSNNTGNEITLLYKDNSKIKVICLEENLGFSAGNNVGYVYAKQTLYSDYIIMINNDIEIIQEDFIQKAIECYKKYSYYVLGPDIVNLNGEHQNPVRDHIISKSDAQKWLIKQYIISKYLYIHDKLKVNIPNIFFAISQNLSKSTRKSVKIDYMQTNVSLYGACFVFSPLFIKSSSFAFEELTFMYGEEELLSLRCKRNKWLIVYNPDLQIFHAEQVSTKMMHQELIDRKIFITHNIIKAIKEILKKLNSDESII